MSRCKLDTAPIDAAVLAAAERLAPNGGPLPLEPLARHAGSSPDQTRFSRARLKVRGLWRWEESPRGHPVALVGDPCEHGPDWPPEEELAERIAAVRPRLPPPPEPPHPPDLRRRVRAYRLEWRLMTGRSAL